MEWDAGLPWYRPVRLLHATPGSDFGSRAGSANTPSYAIDGLPAALEVGRGAPVGLEFYEHESFPEKYRGGCFLADWSQGLIYAARFQRDGSTYRAELDRFGERRPVERDRPRGRPRWRTVLHGRRPRQSRRCLPHCLSRGGKQGHRWAAGVGRGGRATIDLPAATTGGLEQGRRRPPVGRLAGRPVGAGGRAGEPRPVARPVREATGPRPERPARTGLPAAISPGEAGRGSRRERAKPGGLPAGRPLRRGRRRPAPAGSRGRCSPGATAGVRGPGPRRVQRPG